MSRNSTSGVCRSIARSAATPSVASAQISSSGQSVDSDCLSCASSTGSSSAITALGALIGNFHHDFGAAGGDLAQVEAGVSIEEFIQALPDTADGSVFGVGVEGQTCVR